MAFLGLFKKEKAGLRAAIDVGSYSVKAVVFEKGTDGGTPRVLKKLALKLPVNQEPVRTVFKLRELVFAMVKELGAIPERITIALGPALGEYSLKSWASRSVSGFGGKILSKDVSSYFQNLLESHRDRESYVLAYPTDYLINGYSRRELSKKENGVLSVPKSLVKEIEFRTLVLSMSEETGRALAEAKKSLGGLPIEFVPLGGIFREALSYNLKINDALLMDVGGKNTSLVLLKDGAIRHAASFPLGTYQVLHNFSKSKNISWKETEEKADSYFKKRALGTDGTKMREFLEKEITNWQKLFLDALDSFYTTGPLPAKIYLFGGGAYLPEIRNFLRNPGWLGNFSYASQPDFKILEARGIFGGDTLSGFMQGPEETSLAALIVYSLRHESIF